MRSATYNSGATWGLEKYLTERQAVETFAMPQIRGYLAGCARHNTEYLAGALHGFALGAQFDMAHNSATIEGRFDMAHNSATIEGRYA